MALRSQGGGFVLPPGETFWEGFLGEVLGLLADVALQDEDWVPNWDVQSGLTEAVYSRPL